MVVELRCTSTFHFQPVYLANGWVTVADLHLWRRCHVCLASHRQLTRGCEVVVQGRPHRTGTGELSVFVTAIVRVALAADAWPCDPADAVHVAKCRSVCCSWRATAENNSDVSGVVFCSQPLRRPGMHFSNLMVQCKVAYAFFG